MAFVTLDDGAGSAEILVYNETFDASRNLLREDQLVIAEVRVQQRTSDDGQVQGLRIIAESVYSLSDIRKRFAKRLRIACNGNAQADRLFELLAPYRSGTCPIVLQYRNDGIEGELELPDSWRVTLDEPLLTGLADWLQPESIRVIY
jgi:DNA polymerase-3 subunit alpha